MGLLNLAAATTIGGYHGCDAAWPQVMPARPVFRAPDGRDQSVLFGFAWNHAVPVDTVLVHPFQNGPAGKLGAAVADDAIGRPGP